MGGSRDRRNAPNDLVWSELGFPGTRNLRLCSPENVSATKHPSRRRGATSNPQSRCSQSDNDRRCRCKTYCHARLDRFCPQAAISVGLCIPLYFARRSSRASLPLAPSSATENMAPVRKVSPADLLSGKARPARQFSPSSQASAADLPFNSPAAIEETFNPAFYTFGAFGLATAAVWASAALGVFAVHRITGASSVSSLFSKGTSNPNPS